MKHIEGPWFSSFESGRYVISCKGVFGPYKALAVTGGFYPEHEGNALLISAAPDLLEACKRLLDAFYEDPSENDTASAVELAYDAIAKATGEDK